MATAQVRKDTNICHHVVNPSVQTDVPDDMIFVEVDWKDVFLYLGKWRDPQTGEFKDPPTP